MLLVDDNHNLTDFLSKELKSLFKAIYIAHDGREAFEIAQKQVPDIIVSDVMMPVMNGYELCKAVKENISISHIPVILLTARNDEQSRLYGYKIGADAYLGKPFEIDTLVKIIQNRLYNREQTKEHYQHIGNFPQPLESTFSQADETFLLKFNKLISENISNPSLDIPFICREIGMSKTSLYNKLKAITDMGANDYINKFRLDRVDYVFRNWHPQVVFHAAAYKHVPLMEENPCEAIRTNVFGTRVMADAAVSYGVEKFVMISTDKAVNPTNIMGCSKRLAEIYVQSLSLAIERGEVKGDTRFITTRFGNVLGSNGSVIPRFREQIAQGGPVTVTHPDIIRYFMTIPEACRLVLEAGTMGKGGEIFIFDMGEPVKIADLAKRMIELSGLQVDKDIEIKYTGLRPGEKLYEELLNNKENTKETPHEKIRVAAVREYIYKDVVEHINVLTEVSLRVQILPMVKEMKAFVPEFKSQNSRFEELD